MRKPKPEYPVQSLGDIIDKISILTRKIYFGEERAVNEHAYLVNGLTKMGLPGTVISTAIRLTQMNFEIWNLENEIREAGEKMPDALVGKRAKKIRDLNFKRITYKNELNRLTGLGFREFKVKHRSQC